MKTPLVSVIMATHNRAELVGRAIKSVINQSFNDWEFIIIDDASTDNTLKILSEWQKKEPRIKIITNKVNLWKDKGLGGVLNKAIKGARGKYIARIDDDDYWLDNNKLKKQVEFLEQNPDYVLCGGGVVVEDNSGKEKYRYLKIEKDKDIRKKVLFANPFAHSSTVYLKSAYDKVGGYENQKYIEDWELWLKLGKIGKFYNFQEYFLRYLSDDRSLSFIHQKAQFKTALSLILKYKNNYPNWIITYLLNLVEYLYAFLPIIIKKPLHLFLTKIKRSVF